MSRFARDAVLATGATFANRVAPCGYELVEVPRNKDRIENNASRLRSKAGVPPKVARNGLTVTEVLARLDPREPWDGSIGRFTDNAGALVPGGFAEPGKSNRPPVFARERKKPIPWRIRQ